MFLAHQDYVFDEDAEFDFFDEDVPLGERHEWNERGDDVNLDEMTESIIENGLFANMSSCPIIMEDLSKGKSKNGKTFFKFLGFAHRLEAIYRACARNPTHPNVRATIATGLKRCLKLNPRSPKDVCKYFKETANKWGSTSGYQLSEFIQDSKVACLSISKFQAEVCIASVAWGCGSAVT